MYVLIFALVCPGILMLDFSLSPPVHIALLTGLFMPLYLALIARVPALYGRNAIQFLIAFCMLISFWSGFVFWDSVNWDFIEIVTGFMILGSATLFYLEIWALLSRGYTLGLLLTLHRAKTPLSESELAEGYRGGEGVSWIMKHRLSGLKAARLVQIRDQHIILTPTLGALVALSYKIILGALGLRKTG